jgi:hypothetical protein
MLAKLRGPSTVEVEEQSVVEETVSPQVEPDVQEASSAEPEEEGGHNVPYQRFQQVISARNKLQNEKERLAAQLEELQTKFEHNTTQDRVETYEEEDLYSGQEDYDDELDPRYAALESRVQEFEVYKQEQLLERELKQVGQEFPTVPRELLLQAVINDPDANLMDVAGQYTTYVAQMEEGAIARYIEENNIAVPNRSASAGGSSGGQNTNSAMNAGNKQKPKNIREATSRFKAFLKNNPF